MEKTGEREIPASAGTLQGVDNSHIARYLFAFPYVENKTVLDCACGIGYGTKLLSEKAKSTEGWEVSTECVELAKKYYQKNNCDFRAVDAEKNLPKDRRFDVIVSFETIEHLENGEHFLSEIFQILNPGGTLVLSTPFIDYRGFSGWQFHKREYTYRQLDRLLSKHFKHIRYSIQPGAGLYIVPFYRRFFEDCSTAQTSILAVCSNNPLPSFGPNLKEMARIYFNGIVKRKTKDLLKIVRILKN